MPESISPILYDQYEWQVHAVCRNAPDPDVWFPKPRQCRRESMALRLCGTCPVTAECLEAATRDDLTDGIRGGLTEKERRHLHRRAQRAKAKAQTPARLDYHLVLLAVRGEDADLSAAEEELLCDYAKATDMPWQMLGSALKIRTRRGVNTRKAATRRDEGSPEADDARDARLAALLELADANTPRRLVRRVSA